MQRLKKILIVVIGLLVALVALDFTLDFFARRNRVQEMGKLNSVIKRQFDPDIVVWGSSFAWVGVNPDIISEKTHAHAYNMAFDGSSFDLYNGVVNQMLDYSTTCRTMIFVVSYNDFKKHDKIYHQEIYLPYLSNDNIYKCLSNVNRELWKSRFIPFYKYTLRGEIYYKYVLKGIQEFIGHPYPCKEINGYLPLQLKWSEENDEKYDTKVSIEFNDGNFIDFKNVINRVKSKGIRPIIIIPPHHKIGLNSFSDFDILRNNLNEFSRKEHVIYSDFTKTSLSDNIDLFYNGGHLNEDGSLIFSRMLADSIVCWEQR
ncbi:MAG: hypothetical protein ACHQET_02980 [Chitinophagales bacterium]